MLNKTEGEMLGALGRGKVVPTDKWIGFLDTARQFAELEFQKKGARLPIRFSPDDILVQEYHLAQMIVFIFAKKIKGETYYYTYDYKFPPELISQLVLTGQWPVIEPLSYAVN